MIRVNKRNFDSNMFIKDALSFQPGFEMNLMPNSDLSSNYLFKYRRLALIIALLSIIFFLVSACHKNQKKSRPRL